MGSVAIIVKEVTHINGNTCIMYITYRRESEKVFFTVYMYCSSSHIHHLLSFPFLCLHFSILIRIIIIPISLFPFLYLSSFPFHSRQKPTLRSKVYCLSHSVTQQIMVKYNQLTESHSWDWQDWLQDRYSMRMSTIYST